MRMSTATSGHSSRKRWMMPGSQCMAMLALALTRMISVREEATCSITLSSRALACRNSRTAGAMRSPSSVRRTPLRPRSSSVKPTSFSSEFIMCVRPDCV